MKSNSLRFLNSLWLFTVLYYCFGRVKWIIPSYSALLIYIGICYISINIGYKYNRWQKVLNESGYHNINSNSNSNNEIDGVSYNKVKKLFIFSCCFLMFSQIAWVYSYFGSFSFFNIIETIGSNYYSRLDTEFSNNNILMQIKTLFWIFSYFVYPIGFYYFKEMPMTNRLLFCITLIIDVLAGLNMGVSKNLGDILILFIAITIIKPQTSNLRDTIIKKYNTNRKKILTVIIISFVFLISFGVIQTQRNLALGRTGIDMKVNPLFGSLRSITITDFLFGGGTTLSNIFDQFGRYLSHGYTGLAYALTLDFKNTWGLGFSRALMDYANQYFGIDVRDLTYCARLETNYGWLNGVNWPTAFVWIGNAVSLWLVPFVLIWLGQLLCKAEYTWRYKHRLTGLIVYSQLYIAFIYMSCNAQIVQSRQSFIATIMMLILFNGYRFKIGTNKLVPHWL